MPEWTHSGGGLLFIQLRERQKVEILLMLSTTIFTKNLVIFKGKGPNWPRTYFGDQLSPRIFSDLNWTLEFFN